VGVGFRSIKNRTELTRTILEFCVTFDHLKLREAKIISEHIGTPLCMNFSNSSCGFAAGDLNPGKLPSERLKRSLRWKGLNNPMYRPDIRLKATLSRIGLPSKTKGISPSDETRRKMSVSRTGIKISDQGRLKLSASRLRDYATGVRVPARGMLGKKHSTESKEVSSATALLRPRLVCKVCTKQNHTRWHGIKCKLATEMINA
jgi:hypothetical protein